MTNLQKRRKQFRFISWSGALLVIVILMVLNFVMSYLPLRLDTSSGKAYSLSAGSKEILKKLDDTLIVRVVFSSELPSVYKLNERYLTDLLSEYKRASHGKIRVEFFDPAKDPKGKQEAMSWGIPPVQLDVRERDRREVKECFMGVAFMYGDKRDAIGIIQDTDNLEYEISVRLKRLLDPVKPTLGFATNGEGLTLSSKSLENLSAPLNQLYTIQNVDLSQTVPTNLKALWIIGPTKPFDAQSVANLLDYSKSGGFVGLLLNRNEIMLTQFTATPTNDGLDEFLFEWGLKLNKGLVVDQRADRIQIQMSRGGFQMVNIIDYPYMPLVPDLNRKHPTTKNLDMISLPFVSPIEVVESSGPTIITPLARSSNMSFLDNQPGNLSPMNPKAQSADAIRGPFNLAVLAENNGSRLVVFGTSRFIQAEYPASPSNLGLLGNLIDWSLQDEALIQIRSKGMSRRPIKDLSDRSRVFYKYLMLFGLPIFSLLLGLWVWRSQKIRRAMLPLRYLE